MENLLYNTIQLNDLIRSWGELIMDRVSRETKKLLEDLRSAVDEARRTRETTQRLLHRTRREEDLSTPVDASSPPTPAPRLRLHRVSRW